MRVLLVDDDEDSLDAVSAALEFHWQDVVVLRAASGEQALRLFERDPDVVVLDVSMPGMSGFDVLREIRRVSDVPVLMLTGRDAETDQVRGFDLGADDYVVKPFTPLALLARVKSLMRRAYMLPPARATPDFSTGDLTVNFETQEVRLGDEVVRLTAPEYRLLLQLVRAPGRVVPHRVLIDRIWGAEWGATTNNLKALVSRLRGKIESGGRRYIQNERGLGYRFIRSVEAGRAGSPAPRNRPAKR